MKKVEDCHRCPLLIKRKNIVNTWGNPDSTIIFIGEAPGYYEDKTGIPFTGKSGKLLRHYIKQIGLEDLCLLTNMIRCKPPANRIPRIHELRKCFPYLKEDIKSINPKIIVLVGNIAKEHIIPSTRSIRNVPIWDKANNRYFIHIYHPAYILRNPDKELEFYKQFLTIMDIYIKHVGNVLYSRCNKNLNFETVKYKEL